MGDARKLALPILGMNGDGCANHHFSTLDTTEDLLHLLSVESRTLDALGEQGEIDAVIVVQDFGLNSNGVGAGGGDLGCAAAERDLDSAITLHRRARPRIGPHLIRVLRLPDRDRLSSTENAWTGERASIAFLQTP